MQKKFKCQQCKSRFVAEDDLMTRCPECGSDMIRPILPRKMGVWVYAVAFLVFLAIGFGASELIKPKFQSKPEQLYLNVSQNSIVFDAAGGMQQCNISSNTTWAIEVSGGEGWLMVNPMGTGQDNATLLFQVTPNEDSVTREATIVVTWKDSQQEYHSESIIVSQENMLPNQTYLKVGQGLMAFDAAGGTKQCSISSNTTWTIQVSGGEGWLKVNPTGDGQDNATVSCQVRSNEDTGTRKATIVVSWKDDLQTSHSERIVVTQGNKQPDRIFFKSSQDKIKFDAAGGTKKCTISSNTSWSVEVNGGEDWLTVNPTGAGQNNATLVCQAKANESGEVRSTFITIKWTDGQLTQSKSIAVSQTGKTTAFDEAAVKEAIRQGKNHPLISFDCPIIVNESPTQYDDFQLGVDFNHYANIHDIRIKYDVRSKKIVEIRVNATEYK